MNAKLEIEKKGPMRWVATMDIDSDGSVGMRATGETLQQAFDNFMVLMVEGALEHWTEGEELKHG